MSDTISLTIKSSGDTKYEVEISPTITVLELKQEIAEKSEVPADRQRLIYSGKVLKDTEVISSYKVQSGHTIHMVKSAGAKLATDASVADGASASGNATSGNSGTGNLNRGNIPSNIAAGPGAFNPLADLTGARYAGFTQLPSASMFGPDGGMNNTTPDPEELSLMMSNPLFQESMNSMLSNPQMLDYLINQSPQLRAMGPQVREMLQSPFFRQMMSNPETMRSMMEMGRNSGMAGAGGSGAFAAAAAAANAFPAPGANPAVTSATDSNTSAPTETSNTTSTADQSGNQANQANPANPANPFASFFPNGVPPIDPLALFGGVAPAAAAAPVDNRPPEERFEEQLRQLNDMGFFDFDRNVAALRRSGGSVQGAIEYLLSN